MYIFFNTANRTTVTEPPPLRGAHCAHPPSHTSPSPPLPHSIPSERGPPYHHPKLFIYLPRSAIISSEARYGPGRLSGRLAHLLRKLNTAVGTWPSSTSVLVGTSKVMGHVGCTHNIFIGLSKQQVICDITPLITRNLIRSSFPISVGPRLKKKKLLTA